MNYDQYFETLTKLVSVLQETFPDSDEGTLMYMICGLGAWGQERGIDMAKMFTDAGEFAAIVEGKAEQFLNELQEELKHDNTNVN